jgi:hypothetical protein
MATTANIYGTIQIGDPANPPLIDIPIDAVIPPATPGVFVFDYEAPDIETATKINIASFLKWLGSAMSVDIPITDLPESIRLLTIAILKFHLDTEGNFDIKIEIGSTVADRWVPEWKPVPTLGITLIGFGFEVTNMTELSSLQDRLLAHQDTGIAALVPAPEPESDSNTEAPSRRRLASAPSA